VTSPLEDTASNFARTIPMLLALSVFTVLFTDISLSLYGVALAIISGALASGIGYAIWYRALSGLSSLQAGVVQLTVPVIAAAGGVVWVAETPDTRLVVSSAIVLGGIAMVFKGRHVAAKGRARH
jgi:drug/metabolite transporter (DMT)-like permease